MSESLKQVFINHSISSIKGMDNTAIFGYGEDGKMNICNNYVKSAFVEGLYEGDTPVINFTKFAEESRDSLNSMGIKNITGDFHIFVDDGNVLKIEGGIITLR